MGKDWPDDTFTENDVLFALEGANLRYKNGQRYILSQCPLHDDQHPSVQIYKDDWFVNCHSGCGRFHITKAFPELRDGNQKVGHQVKRSSGDKTVSQHQYKEVDLIDLVLSMDKIPDDHALHGVPAETLNDLGWRWDKEAKRYFIPYWSASKTSVPFAQWRNLGDGPRFNFWKDAKPTCYGTWNLDNHKLFVVEGASDAAVLEYAAVPWIALPSAASGELMRAMATYCKENGIQLIYAGDNDSAGDKLREALDEICSYRVKQPPTKYKDWGEFLEATSVGQVQEYCFEELFGKVLPASITPEVTANEETSVLEDVEKVFPGAQQLEIVNDAGPRPEGKELPSEPAPILY